MGKFEDTKQRGHNGWSKDFISCERSGGDIGVLMRAVAVAVIGKRKM